MSSSTDALRPSALLELVGPVSGRRISIQHFQHHWRRQAAGLSRVVWRPVKVPCGAQNFGFWYNLMQEQGSKWDMDGARVCEQIC